MLLTFFNISHHSSFLIPVSPLLLVWEATKKKEKNHQKVIKSRFFQWKLFTFVTFYSLLQFDKGPWVMIDLIISYMVSN